MVDDLAGLGQYDEAQSRKTSPLFEQTHRDKLEIIRDADP